MKIDLTDRSDSSRVISLVFFNDRDPAHKVGAGEPNKVGYVTQSGTVVHLRGRRLIVSNRAALERFNLSQVDMPASEDECEAAENIFARRPLDPVRFNAALLALKERRLVALAKNIEPIPFEKLSAEEREIRWRKLAGSVQRGDLLMTFNSDSFISRMIAWVDRGPWSHSALCSGNGTVFEAITQGVCERPLDVYRPENFRLGLYRLPLSEQQREKLPSDLKGEVAYGYSYKKAMVVGWFKFAGLMRNIPTPNDLLLLPNLELVAIV